MRASKFAPFVMIRSSVQIRPLAPLALKELGLFSNREKNPTALLNPCFLRAQKTPGARREIP